MKFADKYTDNKIKELINDGVFENVSLIFGREIYEDYLVNAKFENSFTACKMTAKKFNCCRSHVYRIQRLFNSEI